MLAAGVQLQQYVGVDINPAPEEVMRQTLVPVVGIDRFTYSNVDFYKCSMADYPNPRGATGAQEDCMTVVTTWASRRGKTCRPV